MEPSIFVALLLMDVEDLLRNDDRFHFCPKTAKGEWRERQAFKRSKADVGREGVESFQLDWSFGLCDQNEPMNAKSALAIDT